MRSYRLTAKAKADLDEVAAFTFAEWGLDRALAYVDALEECCEQLGEHPSLGTAASELAAGLRRQPHRSPVVFCQRASDGVLIVRILHASMDVPRHWRTELIEGEHSGARESLGLEA